MQGPVDASAEVMQTRHFLLNYFQGFQPVKCMTAEIVHVHDSTSSPTIIVSRNMDNNYVCLYSVPEDLLDAVRELMTRFYAEIYQIPMKWEPEGNSITWCEAALSTTGSLVLKGVPHQPLSPSSICAMWERWPDRWSPNYPLVLQSMLPSVVNKALVLCSAPFFRVLNLQAIVQGCGFKSYPWALWWMPVRVRLRHLALISDIPLRLVGKWYTEGQLKQREVVGGPL